MEKNQYKNTKLACYMTSFTMSAVVNLSPLLFVTFREMYGISYTLMGLLVAINFGTQLLIDLIFSFFTKYFNIEKTVRITPFLAFVGIVAYACLPNIFPSQAYLWITAGTIISSVSSGLAEVLMSPVVAAIPAENPEREMSKLHSMYAWGVVIVVVFSTLFLNVFGRTNWMYLAILWSLIPFVAWILYLKSDIPHLEIECGSKQGFKISGGLMLCVMCIFLGGASECTMSQWVSGFAEKALGISKVMGDIFGMALFGLMLGMGRTLYSKIGKNVINVMLVGMIGAFICYTVAGICLNSVVALIACGVAGLCTSLLWPGTLIYAEEKLPGMGVAAYALLAAGGDLGASAVPQMVGIIADTVSASDFAVKFGNTAGLGAEQIGMRMGILVAGIFPLLGVALILFMKTFFKRCCK